MEKQDKSAIFTKMCTTPPYEEVKDDRDESALPELVEVARLRDEGLVQDALEYARALGVMFPDFDLVHYMSAHIYFGEHDPQNALKTAIDAIPIMRRKYRMYSIAGLAEYDMGRVPEALVWWSRSIIAQALVTDYQEYDPFLHIAYAATVIGAHREARIFQAISDAIDPNAPRYTEEYINRLAPLRGSWAESAFQQVVQTIANTYLA